MSLDGIMASMDLTALLRLQQFADSALPVGGAAHSFGLESLVEWGMLDADGVQQVLLDYVEETGAIEAAYCARSSELAGGADLEAWIALNQELGARKLARESRDASAAMGRRFLNLAAHATRIELIERASESTSETHLAASFGLTAGALDIDAKSAAAAYLQQSATALVSCCQRLLPLGQTRAHQILWDIKPAIVRIAQAAQLSQLSCFTPLLDVASGRHPLLHTRLFMS
ncbi:MAG TPA: urease accessory UreF family protein [Bryobacteraceae bacterium]|nr:urease accessory UreF family protein [Bryobacteraceae bacterium]